MRSLPAALALVALTLAALVSKLPGVGGAARYDDGRFLDLNPRVQDAGRLAAYTLDPRADVPGVRLPDYPWRPVSEASFLIVERLGGGVKAQRLANLVLHVGASVLAWLILRRLLAGDPAGAGAWPLLGALGFAIHPIGVQAAVYATQRFVGLMTFLGFLALWAYLKSRDGGGRGWTVLGLAASVLAMGAKESAATLPLWLAACEAGPPRTWWRRWMPWALPALLVVVQVARLGLDRGVGAVQPGRSEGPLAGMAQQAAWTAWYALQTALPLRLSFFGEGFPSWAGWIALTGLAVAAAWAAFGPASHRLARMGLALFLAPQVLEILSSGYAFHHRCYPSLLGGAMLAVLAASRLRRGFAGGASALMLVGVLGVVESARWGGGLTLTRWAARVAPGTEKNRLILPEIAASRGETARALRLYRGVMALPGADPSTVVGWARALERQGRPAAALALLEQALETPDLESDYDEEAARLAWGLGDAAKARRLLEGAVRKRPSGAGVDVAQMWIAWGDPAAAERLLRTAVDALPRHTPAWQNLGIALSRLDRLPEAEAACRRAVALDPSRPSARNDLASVLALMDRLAEAEAELREAIRLDPGYRMGWINLALVLEDQGRGSEAAEARTRAAACPEAARLLRLDSPYR